MNIDSSALSPVAVVALATVHVLAVLASAWQAPWRDLRAVPKRMHLVSGALITLLVLWSIGGRVGAQVSLHLLGMTAVALLLGPALAILVGTLALVVFMLLGRVDLTGLLIGGAVTVVLPVMVTVLLLRFALRHAPRNLFVYTLGVGFLGGALSMLAVALAWMGLSALAGETRAVAEWTSPLLVLAMFPEGFVNGAVISALAVYKPDWLRSFDDRHFLG